MSMPFQDKLKLQTLALYSVDIGITTTTLDPPALDIAALCLSSWPASNLLFSSNFNQSAYAT